MVAVDTFTIFVVGFYKGIVVAAVLTAVAGVTCAVATLAIVAVSFCLKCCLSYLFMVVLLILLFE